jgi:hypothetical protein
MLRLTEQRRLLAETVRALANLVVGALVLGQFLAAEPSMALAAAGGVAWLSWWDSHWCASRGEPMLEIMALPFGIAAVVGVVLLLDWWGRRRERPSKPSHH